MDELTKILKWGKVSFPRDSARFGKPLFAVHKNHLESFVKNTDSQTSDLENVISRTDVSLGIAYFSNKVVSNQILKYATLHLLNAYKERINPYNFL